MINACLAYMCMRDPVDYLFDWSASSHARLSAARYRAVADTTTDTGKMRQTFGIGYIRPNDFQLSIQDSTGAERTRTLYLDQRLLTVFEPKTRQYVQKRMPSNVSIKEAVLTEIPQLDDLVFALADPAGIESYYGKIRQLKPWNWKHSGDEVSLVHQKGATVVAINLSAKTGLINRVALASQGQATDWKFTYEPTSPRSVAFQAPTGSYAVSELDPEVHEPTYGSNEARILTQRMFKAYDRPKALAFEVSEGGEKTLVWFRPGAVRQKNAAVDFVFRGGKATVVSYGSRTAYSGAAKTLQVIDAVGESGGRIDPALRSLMRGQNPFRLLLGEKCRVSVKGRMELSGARCTILEVDNKVARLSLVVRNADGRVMSIGSEPKDSTGQRTAASQRILRYLPTTEIESGEVFEMKTPPEFGQRPLDEIVSKDLIS